MTYLHTAVFIICLYPVLLFWNYGDFEDDPKPGDQWTNKTNQAYVLGVRDNWLVYKTNLGPEKHYRTFRVFKEMYDKVEK